MTFDQRAVVLGVFIVVAVVVDVLFGRTGIFTVAAIVLSIAVGWSNLGISKEERRKYGR